MKKKVSTKVYKNKINKVLLLLEVVVILFCQNISWAWFDETHLAIAKAACYTKWYNAVAADVTKVKAGQKEAYNHWANETANEITADIVKEQIERYDRGDDRDGHLYGALVASLRKYDEIKNTPRKTGEKNFPDYHLDYFTHYVGDLTQPFHNIPYDKKEPKFHTREMHDLNDGRIENDVLKNVNKIKKLMTHKIQLRPDHFEDDLINEIVRIANRTRGLGKKLRAENRPMTEEEAYAQTALSADLLEAVIMQKNPSYRKCDDSQ